jgi:hypothetical protein
MTVTTKPGHRGEREVSRKPLRREGRSDPACTCGSCPMHFFRTGAMGVADTRPSLRPLFFWRDVAEAKARARCAARMRSRVSPTRHAPRVRGIQYAEASPVKHDGLWNTGSPGPAHAKATTRPRVQGRAGASAKAASRATTTGESCLKIESEPRCSTVASHVGCHHPRKRMTQYSRDINA